MHSSILSMLFQCFALGQTIDQQLCTKTQR